MFSGVLWTCLCLLRCFCCYDFFFDVFIVNFEQISHLIYFYLLSVLYWVQKKPPEVFFKKRYSLKLRNIFRKTLVLGSFFKKVVGLHNCKYIKKRLQHRCFLRNLRKILRTHFLKNICKTSASLSGFLGWVKVKKITEIVVKARSSHRWCPMKKLFLNILQYSQGNTCAGVY